MYTYAPKMNEEADSYEPAIIFIVYTMNAMNAK